MAPVEITDDYYAVLEVSHDASNEVVRKNYLRLAIRLHPDRNPDKADAKAAFQLLSSAYETINDPDKRRTYNERWASIRQNRYAQEQVQKRQDEAAEIRRKWEAEAKVNRREESARQERLQHLQKLKWGQEDEIYEASRGIRRLTAELNRLKALDDEAIKKERELNGWWRFITSSISGKVIETEEQKQGREMERLQRVASKSIKESEIAYQEDLLRRSRLVLEGLDRNIAAVKKLAEDEARAKALRQQEISRKVEEARRGAQEEQMRRDREMRMEEQLRQEQEQAAWLAERIRKAQQAREVQARLQKEAKERLQTEAANGIFAQYYAERKPETPYNSTGASGSHSSGCRHDKFWPELRGPHRCRKCQTMQRRFALQCPDCSMVACADCRQTLRRENTGIRGRSGQRPKRGRDDRDYWNFEIPYGE